MPEISRFFGIIIKMFPGDHAPPHFHAEYNEYRAIIDIRTSAIIAGHLPARAMGLVVEWATLHRAELLDLWDQASDYQPLYKIDPLT